MFCKYTAFFVLLRYLLFVDVVLSVSLELFSLDITLQYRATSGRMQADCGSWIRWLVSIRSCADKLGGGSERVNC